jgi:phosphomannomutase
LNDVQVLLNKLRSAEADEEEIVDLKVVDPRLDMLETKPDSQSRALIRASGTEPKLKCYLECSAESKEQAKQRLAQLDSHMRKFLEQ